MQPDTKKDMSLLQDDTFAVSKAAMLFYCLIIDIVFYYHSVYDLVWINIRNLKEVCNIIIAIWRILYKFLKRQNVNKIVDSKRSTFRREFELI